MDNKSDEQFIIMQAIIEANKQEMKSNKKDPNEKIMKLTEDFKEILASITDQINTLKYSPTQKDSTNPPYHNTVVPAYRRDPPLDGGKSEKMVVCGL